MLLASTRMADFSHTATFEFLRRFPLAGMDQVLVMSADNVGSQQMHIVRAELRKSPQAEIIMGKNTMIKYVIRKYAVDSGDAAFNKLADACKLNVGLVFTNDDMKKVKDVLEKNKVHHPIRRLSTYLHNLCSRGTVPLRGYKRSLMCQHFMTSS